MRYLNQWLKILKEKHPLDEVNEISTKVKKRYQELPPVDSSAFRLPIKSDLLPLLALYQTLSLDRTRSQAQILMEMESLYELVYARSLKSGIRLLRLWPNPFPLIRKALAKMSRDAYAPGDAEIIEDSAVCFAINGKRCYIQEELTRRGAPELTRVFCKTDDWLAACLPAVRFTRTQTLATGGKLCDFRWEQVQTDQQSTRN